MLLDDRKVRADDGAASEGAHGQSQGQRSDQHPQTGRRAAAHHREANAVFSEPAGGALARRRDPLVRGHKRAVDIGDDKRYGGHG